MHRNLRTKATNVSKKPEAEESVGFLLQHRQLPCAVLLLAIWKAKTQTQFPPRTVFFLSRGSEYRELKLKTESG